MLIAALALRHRMGGRLEARIAGRTNDRDRLARGLARYHGLSLLDPLRDPPLPGLVDMVDPAFCLREALLPWRRLGAATMVLTARPEEFENHRPMLERTYGPVIAAYAEPEAIEAALLALCGQELARRAEGRVSPSLSCRQWSPARYRPLFLLTGIALLIACVTWPTVLLTAVTLAVTFMLAAVVGLKALAAAAGFHNELPTSAALPPSQFPIVSILVALHREADIAPRLVARLSRLEYPRDRLEVLLVVEEHDRLTREALAAADLPGWMRVVAVPHGTVKTKPRALNHALDQCRGSIVGVYDAEDAPDPDQITRVVQRFHASPAETVCLQGRLDFYNPKTNGIARCFTMEYASWFRLILPGYDRLRLAVPLGGTTLFFRREALAALGGWDAWNVTEDADLGLRLARRGWRTEVIDTVTEEEACCRALPWVRQRSRWIKGYMMTWGAHMRDPQQLWQDLGPWRFIGVQIQFLGSATQNLFAPVLWSLWPIAFGYWHPIVDVLPHPWILAMTALFVSTQAIDLTIAAIALRRSRHPFSPIWLPVLMFYHMMAVPAAWKALWEVMTRPFYWDKTTHGLFG
ncbi:glycosyltransferase [Neotabrizicola shimadae]|uniref:glycosyltransferase n=1 Tax=Neotabrizicola shimadae TaxID=2807096 RepID=UPI002176D68A|nr:glycosyltransferase [Neotabrizicola shimadae]